MRHAYRIGALPLVILVLYGCSYAEVLSGLQPTQPPPTALVTIVVSTPTTTGTVTPTQPTPSFTPTPTLIPIESNPQLAATPQPPANAIGTPTAFVPPATATPLLFIDTSISGKQIFWGSCSPNSTVVTAHVDPSAHIESVQMALRLENPKTGDTTPWGGYALMEDKGGGEFRYRLTAESFSKYHEYLSAWGQFQLIAIDRNEAVVGRSMQFLHLLVVAPCP